MPKSYYSAIKMMRVNAAVTIIALPGIPVLIYFFVLAWINSKYLTLPFIGGAIVALGVAAFITRLSIKNKRPTEQHYEVKCVGLSSEEVEERFGARKIRANASVSFEEYNGVEIRALILNCKDTDERNITNLRKSANRKINREYDVKEQQSLYFSTNIRVNIYVYDNCSLKNRGALSAVANKMIDRNEPIFNFYIDKSDEVIIIPVIYGDLTFKQINFYAEAVRFVISRLT